MLLFHQQPTQQYTERYRSNKWRKPIQLLRRFTVIFFVVLFVFFSLSFWRIYRVQRPQSHFQKVVVLTEDENWKNLHEPFRDKHYPKSQRCAIQESMNAHGFSSNKTSQLPTQNFAFVFGGLGAYAKLEAFKCLLAVESLVKVGGYKGDVYFITEPKACVPTQIELRKLLNYDKVYVLSKDDESKLSGESSFSNRRVKKKKKISTYLKDMSVKMDIFQFLPERIQIAAWYDCDVVFGVQDCVKNNLLCDIPAFSSKVPMYNSAGWHLGSFMVHRKYSRDLLRMWKEELFTGKHKSDYPALRVIYERQEDKNTEHRWNLGKFTNEKTGNTYSSNYEVLTSDPARGETYSSWRDVLWNKDTPNSCIMHLSMGRCSEVNNGHVATDALLKTLGLSMMDKKYCSGTPRKIILMNGLSKNSCKNLPFDFIFPIRSKCVLCDKRE